MGQVASAAQNAALASFSLLQKHVLDRRRCTTRDELRIAIITGSNAPTTVAAYAALGRLTRRVRDHYDRDGQSGRETTCHLMVQQTRLQSPSSPAIGVP